MSWYKDYTGQKFGMLTVIKYVKRHPTRKISVWQMRCDCGNLLEATTARLKFSKTQSCDKCVSKILGVQSVTHHKSKTVEYDIWGRMHARCMNVNNPKYHRYGGRGIKVCEKWSGEDGFNNFLKDMGLRPDNLHSLERDNVNGDYEPSNCKWATQKVQCINKESSIRVWFKGKFISWRTACEEAGIEFYKVKNKQWNAKISHQEAFDFFKPPKKQSTLVSHSFGYINNSA